MSNLFASAKPDPMFGCEEAEAVVVVGKVNTGGKRGGKGRFLACADMGRGAGGRTVINMAEWSRV